MTKYTAKDFENARFAEHPQGGVAAKNGPEDSPWSIAEGCWEDGNGMAADGWVPVPMKPQITESEYRLALDETRHPQYVYGFTTAMEKLGGEIIPDPEPTNGDKLADILVESFNSMEFDLEDSFREIAAVLDKHGVTAPNVKGN